MKSGASQIDWSETWGYANGSFQIDYTLVESHADWPFTLLTEISLSCDEVATKRFKHYEEEGLGWFGRAAITEILCDFAANEKIEMLLTDQHPQIMRVQLRDPKIDLSCTVQIRCRRLGQDNGKDQLVKIAHYIEQIRDHIRTTARKATPQEIERLMVLLSKR